MDDHIKLDVDDSNVLLACLMNAADVGESTGNLDLTAMALYPVDLIIDKWSDARRRR